MSSVNVSGWAVSVTHSGRARIVQAEGRQDAEATDSWVGRGDKRMYPLLFCVFGLGALGCLGF